MTTLSDTLAVLGADEAAQVQDLASLNKTLAKEEQIRPNVFTDFSSGMLRGWFRFFSQNGYGVGPAPYGPGTVGPAPTAAEWAQFDAEAAQLGVGGWIQAVIKHIREPSSNFLDKTGRTVATVEEQLDSYVPGWSILLDLTTPIIPALPLLATILSAAASTTPAVVQAVFDAVQEVGSSISYASGGNAPVDKGIAALDQVTQNAISQAFTMASSAANNATLKQFQDVVAHAAYTAQAANGGVIQQLEAGAIDVGRTVVFAIQLAGVAFTAGAATGLFAPVNAAITALLNSVSLAIKSSIAGATATGSVQDQLAAAGLTLAKGLPSVLSSVNSVLDSPFQFDGVDVGAVLAKTAGLGLTAANITLMAEQLHAANVAAQKGKALDPVQVQALVAYFGPQAKNVSLAAQQPASTSSSGAWLLLAGLGALAAAAGRSRG